MSVEYTCDRCGLRWSEQTVERQDGWLMSDCGKLHYCDSCAKGMSTMLELAVSICPGLCQKHYSACVGNAALAFNSNRTPFNSMDKVTRTRRIDAGRGKAEASIAVKLDVLRNTNSSPFEVLGRRLARLLGNSKACIEDVEYRFLGPDPRDFNRLAFYVSGVFRNKEIPSNGGSSVCDDDE